MNTGVTGAAACEKGRGSGVKLAPSSSSLCGSYTAAEEWGEDWVVWRRVTIISSGSTISCVAQAADVPWSSSTAKEATGDGALAFSRCAKVRNLLYQT
eukprot:CAMPEP_0171676750 /NCGR_PEP_ID=MMETSP0990-20121206/54637_1 /TAXON_ID=483369 /ORGANISM="non described non described, Strain CCMP2098" /LENGTH=97 /DNA_ID=CAMNT_0012263023 /DNA_START=79 /DNA_END=373 /DNA_ORIENTATION=-